MALSVVNFRMKHGKEMEQIRFNGNGIKLLDLKREIAERKLNLGQTRQSDYDLKIMDANTNQEFANDDDVVPKNSSIVAQRIPVKNPRFSLLSKIENRGFIPAHLANERQHPTEIIMPTRQEEPDEMDANVARQDSNDDIFSSFAEEKAYVLINNCLMKYISGRLNSDFFPSIFSTLFHFYVEINKQKFKRKKCKQ